MKWDYNEWKFYKDKDKNRNEITNECVSHLWIEIKNEMVLL